MHKIGLYDKMKAAVRAFRYPPIGPHVPVFSSPNLNAAESEIVEHFSRLYYDKLDEGRGLHTIVVSWMGHTMFKCPLDLWIYQEIIVMNEPDIIVEIGTYRGGSALFLASILDLMKSSAKILTIDIDSSLAGERPAHDRIEYIHGSSLDKEVISKIERKLRGCKNPLVILDGDHTCSHVLNELRVYSKMIAPGGYLIAEDTNVNGHPAFASHGPGPWEAVELFLAEEPRFVADRSCERFLLTMNPRGYLRRVR